MFLSYGKLDNPLLVHQQKRVVLVLAGCGFNHGKKPILTILVKIGFDHMVKIHFNCKDKSKPVLLKNKFGTFGRSENILLHILQLNFSLINI